MISAEKLSVVLETEGTAISRTIAGQMAEAIAAGIIPRDNAVITSMAVRVAWQVGMEVGLRMAEVDRIGASEVLEALSEYVQLGDQEALASSAKMATEILRGVYR